MKAETLIVEDNDLQLCPGVFLLEPMGRAVLSARNDLAGLDPARAGKPDLFLMDIPMPEPDGVEAGRRLNPNSEVELGYGQRSWPGARICNPPLAAWPKVAGTISLPSVCDALRIANPRSAGGRGAPASGIAPLTSEFWLKAPLEVRPIPTP